MPERDLWFELPPQRIRELMREATKFYQKGQGKFKSQLIVLLDRETLEKRKALEQSKPKPDYFDEILANYQREHPEEVEIMQNHDDGGGGRGGGLRRFGDLLPTDDEGRRIIGDPGVGCRHCHTVLRSCNEENPNVVVFRPGVECCVAAVLDRITGINDAINTYRYQVDIEGVPVASVEGKTVAALDERKRLRKRLRELERKK